MTDSYRILSEKLNMEKIQWYNVWKKAERSIRVIARGLHASCGKEDIISDLKVRGYNLLNAVNIIKNEKQKSEGGEETIVKRGHHLFITFNNDQAEKKIFDIKTILNIVIKIEPLGKNTRLVPQSKCCQSYNHIVKKTTLC